MGLFKSTPRVGDMVEVALGGDAWLAVMVIEIIASGSMLGDAGFRWQAVRSRTYRGAVYTNDEGITWRRPQQTARVA